MNKRNFWASLAGLTVGTLVLLYGLEHVEPALDALSPFTFTTTAFFTLFIALAYLVGSRTAESNSQGSFIRFIMVLIIVKMLVCVLLIVGYVELRAPEDRLFVFPFLMIYLIFTIFEVIVLQKVGRTRSTRQTEVEQ